MTVDTSRDAVQRLAKMHADDAHICASVGSPCVVREQTSAMLLALLAERDAAKEEAIDARSVLAAWFDLSKKAEEAGTDIIRDSIGTWVRTALNGGMPSKHADIVRNVVNEAARLYLWNALVPVLRTMCDTARTEALNQAADWLMCCGSGNFGSDAEAIRTLPKKDSG